MAMALLTLAALIGVPLMAAWLGWHVYTGAPWRLPDACRLERAGVALIVAVSVFSGWIDICHKALEAIKP